MTVATVIFHKLSSYLFWFLGLFRRALCFIKRRRKTSGSLLPMTNNHIPPTVQAVPSNNEVELESWDNWGMDDSSPVSSSQQQQNHGSRNRTISQNSAEEEPDVDFFQDMQPDFKRPKKILIKKRENNFSPAIGMSSRLAMQPDLAMPLTNELETWEESDSAWGSEVTEDLTWEADEAIKEKKRLERERRHAEQQRKKMEKDMAKSMRKDSPFTAVRLS